MDNRLVFGRNIEKVNTIQKKCTFCGGVNHSSVTYFKRIRQEKEKDRAAGDMENRQT